MVTTEKVCNGAWVLIDSPPGEHQANNLCPDCSNRKSSYILSNRLTRNEINTYREVKTINYHVNYNCILIPNKTPKRDLLLLSN